MVESMLRTARHVAAPGYGTVRLRIWGLLLLLAAMTGCAVAGGGGNSTVCTAIGSQSGIGIEVSPPVAHQVGSEAHVTVRWNQYRVARTAPLSPSSTVSEETCSGNQPDSSCSAKLVPTGGAHGFATIPNLPTTPVQVDVTITATNGTPVVDGTLRITPEATYPNGGKCPAGGNQGQLVVDATGNVRKART